MCLVVTTGCAFMFQFETGLNGVPPGNVFVPEPCEGVWKACDRQPRVASYSTFFHDWIVRPDDGINLFMGALMSNPVVDAALCARMSTSSWLSVTTALHSHIFIQVLLCLFFCRAVAGAAWVGWTVQACRHKQSIVPLLPMLFLWGIIGCLWLTISAIVQHNVINSFCDLDELNSTWFIMTQMLSPAFGLTTVYPITVSLSGALAPPICQRDVMLWAPMGMTVAFAALFLVWGAVVLARATMPCCAARRLAQGHAAAQDDSTRPDSPMSQAIDDHV